MDWMVIKALSVISDAKAVLDLTATVARYILRKSKADAQSQAAALYSADEQQALETTYQEWAHIAASVAPAIETVMERQSGVSLSGRAALLAELAKSYAAEPHGLHPDSLYDINLRHTAFARLPDGRLQLRLGLSDQTRYLLGEAIDVPSALAHVPSFPDAGYLPQHSYRSNGGQMSLPVFKVTMLGDSGSGKTVFMSSMYSKMRLGDDNGITILATNHNINLTLGQNIENLYVHQKWPPGNEGKELTYEFELSLKGRPVALVNWVDYRGGAVWEPEDTPEGQALIKTLQDSHAIILMLDMSRIGNISPDSFQARTITRLGHLMNLCRSASKSRRLRSVLFVRTKADEVQNSDGRPDWNRACDDLQRHLGPVINHDCGPFAALIPVSASGRVKDDKRLEGDDPYNVEWPLILSLAFMMEADLARLRNELPTRQRRVSETRPYELMRFFREILHVGVSDDEREAMKGLSEISRQILGLQDVINGFVRNTPNSIKLIRNQHALQR